LKVLVTDMRHTSLSLEKEVLEPLGVAVEAVFSQTEDELICNGQGAFGFLVSYAPVTRRVMEALPELRIIVKYGVGTDNIDLKAAAELGKAVANVPDYCVEEVALQALSLLLNGLRMTHLLGRQVRDGEWTSHPEGATMYRPSGCNLGLVGFGRIAARFAHYAEATVNKVYYFDPYIRDGEPAPAEYDRATDVRELFHECQLISVHAPLTSETDSLIDGEVLAHAHETILINTSRARIIDKQALLAHLDIRKVIFYGADVYWEEPPNFSDPWNLAFLQRDDVLITPHLGWYSRDSNQELRTRAAEEIARVLSGKRPLNLLTAEA
jgi:D-3-phosphoglycerate dehydrogenase